LSAQIVYKSAMRASMYRQTSLTASHY